MTSNKKNTWSPVYGALSEHEIDDETMGDQLHSPDVNSDWDSPPRAAFRLPCTTMYNSLSGNTSFTSTSRGPIPVNVEAVLSAYSVPTQLDGGCGLPQENEEVQQICARPVEEPSVTDPFSGVMPSLASRLSPQLLSGSPRSLQLQLQSLSTCSTVISGSPSPSFTSQSSSKNGACLDSASATPKVSLPKISHGIEEIEPSQSRPSNGASPSDTPALASSSTGAARDDTCSNHISPHNSAPFAHRTNFVIPAHDLPEAKVNSTSSVNSNSPLHSNLQTAAATAENTTSALPIPGGHLPEEKENRNSSVNSSAPLHRSPPALPPPGPFISPETISEINDISTSLGSSAAAPLATLPVLPSLSSPAGARGTLPICTGIAAGSGDNSVSVVSTSSPLIGPYTAAATAENTTSVLAIPAGIMPESKDPSILIVSSSPPRLPSPLLVIPPSAPSATTKHVSSSHLAPQTEPSLSLVTNSFFSNTSSCSTAAGSHHSTASSRLASPPMTEVGGGTLSVPSIRTTLLVSTIASPRCRSTSLSMNSSMSVLVASSRGNVVGAEASGIMDPLRTDSILLTATGCMNKANHLVVGSPSFFPRLSYPSSPSTPSLPLLTAGDMRFLPQNSIPLKTIYVLECTNFHVHPNSGVLRLLNKALLAYLYSIQEPPSPSDSSIHSLSTSASSSYSSFSSSLIEDKRPVPSTVYRSDPLSEETEGKLRVQGNAPISETHQENSTTTTSSNRSSSKKSKRRKKERGKNKLPQPYCSSSSPCSVMDVERGQEEEKEIKAPPCVHPNHHDNHFPLSPSQTPDPFSSELQSTESKISFSSPSSKSAKLPAIMAEGGGKEKEEQVEEEKKKSKSFVPDCSSIPAPPSLFFSGRLSAEMIRHDSDSSILAAPSTRCTTEGFKRNPQMEDTLSRQEDAANPVSSQHHREGGSEREMNALHIRSERESILKRTSSLIRKSPERRNSITGDSEKSIRGSIRVEEENDYPMSRKENNTSHSGTNERPRNSITNPVQLVAGGSASPPLPLMVTRRRADHIIGEGEKNMKRDDNKDNDEDHGDDERKAEEAKDSREDERQKQEESTIKEHIAEAVGRRRRRKIMMRTGAERDTGVMSPIISCAFSPSQQQKEAGGRKEEEHERGENVERNREAFIRQKEGEVEEEEGESSSSAVQVVGLMNDISLGSNLLGPRGLMPVLTIIRHCRERLERLDLRGNELNNSSIKELASLLRSGFPKLKFIDLRQNRFTFRGGKCLASMCTGDVYVGPLLAASLARTPPNATAQQQQPQGVEEETTGFPCSSQSIPATRTPRFSPLHTGPPPPAATAALTSGAAIPSSSSSSSYSSSLSSSGRHRRGCPTTSPLAHGRWSGRDGVDTTRQNQYTDDHVMDKEDGGRSVPRLGMGMASDHPNRDRETSKDGSSTDRFAAFYSPGASLSQAPTSQSSALPNPHTAIPSMMGASSINISPSSSSFSSSSSSAVYSPSLTTIPSSSASHREVPREEIETWHGVKRNPEGGNDGWGKRKNKVEEARSKQGKSHSQHPACPPPPPPHLGQWDMQDEARKASIPMDDSVASFMRAQLSVGFDNVIEEVLVDGFLGSDALQRCLQKRIVDAIYRRECRKKKLLAWLQTEVTGGGEGGGPRGRKEESGGGEEKERSSENGGDSAVQGGTWKKSNGNDAHGIHDGGERKGVNHLHPYFSSSYSSTPSAALTAKEEGMDGVAEDAVVKTSPRLSLPLTARSSSVFPLCTLFPFPSSTGANNVNMIHSNGHNPLPSLRSRITDPTSSSTVRGSFGSSFKTSSGLAVAYKHVIEQQAQRKSTSSSPGLAISEDEIEVDGGSSVTTAAALGYPLPPPPPSSSSRASMSATSSGTGGILYSHSVAASSSPLTSPPAKSAYTDHHPVHFFQPDLLVLLQNPAKEGEAQTIGEAYRPRHQGREEEEEGQEGGKMALHHWESRSGSETLGRSGTPSTFHNNANHFYNSSTTSTTSTVRTNSTLGTTITTTPSITNGNHTIPESLSWSKGERGRPAAGGGPAAATLLQQSSHRLLSSSLTSTAPTPSTRMSLSFISSPTPTSLGSQSFLKSEKMRRKGSWSESGRRRRKGRERRRSTTGKEVMCMEGEVKEVKERDKEGDYDECWELAEEARAEGVRIFQSGERVTGEREEQMEVGKSRRHSSLCSFLSPYAHLSRQQSTDADSPEVKGEGKPSIFFPHETSQKSLTRSTSQVSWSSKEGSVMRGSININTPPPPPLITPTTIAATTVGTRAGGMGAETGFHSTSPPSSSFSFPPPPPPSASAGRYHPRIPSPPPPPPRSHTLSTPSNISRSTSASTNNNSTSSSFVGGPSRFSSFSSVSLRSSSNPPPSFHPSSCVDGKCRPETLASIFQKIIKNESEKNRSSSNREEEGRQENKASERINGKEVGGRIESSVCRSSSLMLVSSSPCLSPPPSHGQEGVIIEGVRKGQKPSLLQGTCDMISPSHSAANNTITASGDGEEDTSNGGQKSTAHCTHSHHHNVLVRMEKDGKLSGNASCSTGAEKELGKGVGRIVSDLPSVHPPSLRVTQETTPQANHYADHHSGGAKNSPVGSPFPPLLSTSPASASSSSLHPCVRETEGRGEGGRLEKVSSASPSRDAKAHSTLSSALGSQPSEDKMEGVAKKETEKEVSPSLQEPCESEVDGGSRSSHRQMGMGGDSPVGHGQTRMQEEEEEKKERNASVLPLAKPSGSFRPSKPVNDQRVASVLPLSGPASKMLVRNQVKTYMTCTSASSSSSFSFSSVEASSLSSSARCMVRRATAPKPPSIDTLERKGDDSLICNPGYSNSSSSHQNHHHTVVGETMNESTGSVLLSGRFCSTEPTVNLQPIQPNPLATPSSHVSSTVANTSKKKEEPEAKEAKATASSQEGNVPETLVSTLTSVPRPSPLTRSPSRKSRSSVKELEDLDKSNGSIHEERVIVEPFSRRRSSSPPPRHFSPPSSFVTSTSLTPSVVVVDGQGEGRRGRKIMLQKISTSFAEPVTGGNLHENSNLAEEDKGTSKKSTERARQPKNRGSVYFTDTENNSIAPSCASSKRFSRVTSSSRCSSSGGPTCDSSMSSPLVCIHAIDENELHTQSTKTEMSAYSANLYPFEIMKHESENSSEELLISPSSTFVSEVAPPVLYAPEREKDQGLEIQRVSQDRVYQPNLFLYPDEGNATHHPQTSSHFSSSSCSGRGSSASILTATTAATEVTWATVSSTTTAHTQLAESSAQVPPHQALSRYPPSSLSTIARHDDTVLKNNVKPPSAVMGPLPHLKRSPVQVDNGRKDEKKEEKNTMNSKLETIQQEEKNHHHPKCLSSFVATDEMAEKFHHHEAERGKNLVSHPSDRSLEKEMRKGGDESTHNKSRNSINNHNHSAVNQSARAVHEEGKKKDNGEEEETEGVKKSNAGGDLLSCTTLRDTLQSSMSQQIEGKESRRSTSHATLEDPDLQHAILENKQDKNTIISTNNDRNREGNRAVQKEDEGKQRRRGERTPSSHHLVMSNSSVDNLHLFRSGSMEVNGKRMEVVGSVIADWSESEDLRGREESYISSRKSAISSDSAKEGVLEEVKMMDSHNMNRKTVSPFHFPPGVYIAPLSRVANHSLHT